MKSLHLHALAGALLALCACKTGSPAAAPGGKSVELSPGMKVAEVDGQPMTWADVQGDKDVGPKVRKAESEALTKLYDERRGLIEELISRRLLEGEAKAKGKTLDQWF